MCLSRIRSGDEEEKGANKIMVCASVSKRSRDVTLEKTVGSVKEVMVKRASVHIIDLVYRHYYLGSFITLSIY